MSNENKEKARLYWACRRGMLELDLVLLPFFEHCYDALTSDEKQTFIAMLELDDPTLYQWFIARQQPQDNAQHLLVEKIIAYARNKTV
jgi:antitoxin CptB